MKAFLKFLKNLIQKYPTTVSFVIGTIFSLFVWILALKYPDPERSLGETFFLSLLIGALFFWAGMISFPTKK
ncbi:MAG: hypothetical protein U9R00_01850 [Patescibacteria group bacterium]|nr:hypothetical protein [Patescibacteria group bacterium]